MTRSMRHLSRAVLTSIVIIGVAACTGTTVVERTHPLLQPEPSSDGTLVYFIRHITGSVA